MAMGIGSASPRRRGRSRRRAAMAEINVTPLVDVMLVLLIIFMVTAPLLTSGVPIDLPDSRANPLDQDARPGDDVDRPRRVRLCRRSRVPAGQLPAVIGRFDCASATAPLITLRADRALDYGRVMAVMGELNRAGCQQHIAGHQRFSRSAIARIEGWHVRAPWQGREGRPRRCRCRACRAVRAAAVARQPRADGDPPGRAHDGQPGERRQSRIHRARPVGRGRRLRSRRSFRPNRSRFPPRSSSRSRRRRQRTIAQPSAQAAQAQGDRLRPSPSPIPSQRSKPAGGSRIGDDFLKGVSAGDRDRCRHPGGDLRRGRAGAARRRRSIARSSRTGRRPGAGRRIARDRARLQPQSRRQPCRTSARGAARKGLRRPTRRRRRATPNRRSARCALQRRSICPMQFYDKWKRVTAWRFDRKL